ncbi:hypothetical protein T06_13506 [Trichinella sp. T6]|nr:hypothetical protein T06_13506 [Trichinella sp. T6]
MRCPLKSEFEAALTAFLLGAVYRFFPLSTSNYMRFMHKMLFRLSEIFLKNN